MCGAVNSPRLTTCGHMFPSDGAFLTDNGLSFLQRQRQSPLEGPRDQVEPQRRYYPMNTAAAITSSMTHIHQAFESDSTTSVDQPTRHEPLQVSLLSRQTFGATSATVMRDSGDRRAATASGCAGGDPASGSACSASLEVMLHRRLKRDDGRGLGEGVDKVTEVSPLLWLLADPVSATNDRWRRLSQQLHHPLRVVALAPKTSAATAGVAPTEWYVTCRGLCVPRSTRRI